ncbi:pilus assembly protein N-terminal domain-containing protein [Myxococcus sp. AM009]|uniref:pilus assembly protein N-terminal domain-containing protein n=1 Tax=unclassified Myxococcus TaxID=2648731 RepID=UPI001595D4C8|nr:MULTISPECIES: pilus assembly protein N-terminal domain-containing protein [unclassified Myxococcus]NVI98430.1 pilus assembly protein N-terminal domain-containing protein [Myxococcus sp. AM009]NVJ13716.1 pilus assembly protein N-terminal domain-containing protein [Myxococcus sp. AM010]
MPLLTVFSTPSQKYRSRAPRWKLWAPLALTLAASAAWAQDAALEPDYAVEAKNAQPSGLVVRVAPLHQTQLIVENAERVRVQAAAVVEASLGEPNQIMVQGLSLGVSEVLVWRQGIKQPLSVRVEVAK